MKYYIDFDNTLFDTEHFVLDINCILNKYIVSEETIDNIYNFDKEGKNLYNNIVKYISNVHVIKDIDEIFNNTYKYLYEDTIPFLEYCSSEKLNLVLLTKGDYEFQQLKLEHCNIKKYFNDIIITLKHKDELDIDYVNGFFIDDDSVEVKKILSKTKNVIRIMRINNKHSLIHVDNVRECSNLLDLINNI